MFGFWVRGVSEFWFGGFGVGYFWVYILVLIGWLGDLLVNLFRFCCFFVENEEVYVVYFFI